MTLFRKAKEYLTGKYTVLLSFLLLLFIFRPYKTATIYPGIWKAVLTFALLLAIFDVHHRKFVKISASILAAPALIFSWILLFHPTKYVQFGISFFTALFLFICTSSIIYDVLLRARVTIETLRGVICAYFLVAFLFTYIYLVIEYFIPGSFMIDGIVVSELPSVRLYSDLLYFSFVTLLTIGYGDIIAIREVGQTIAVLEGIVGQFYIAILVARIVSVYSFYSDKRLVKEIEKDLLKKRLD